MNFLYPTFLFALLALAIPVAIHLFNFKRYKTVYFSNVQLLKRIQQESRKKSQLKQILILISRILAIASLVFAFSRPYIPVNTRTAAVARQIVGIFIDNSFSMRAEGEKGLLLEQAKINATEIINSYPAGTQFIVLTSEFAPNGQFFQTKEQSIRQISEVKDYSRSPKLADIYAQCVQTMKTAGGKAERTLYILSDFQKKNMSLESTKLDSSVWTYLFPLKSGKTNNLLIDSCWFETPGRKIGQAEKLFVKIKNMSTQSYQNIPIRLTMNDSLKAVANLSIGSQEETVSELNFTNNSDGIQLGKVELDDYPIVFDNSYYLSYEVHGKLKAMAIVNPSNNGSGYLNALFTDDELIDYEETPENNVQMSQIKNYQCIFMVNNQRISSGLKDELTSFVRNGGTLVLFPEKTNNYSEYNSLIQSMNGQIISSFDTARMQLSEINYDHELYREVFKKQEKDADLPFISGFVTTSGQFSQPESTILKFRNGKNALSSHGFGEGRVYTFAFSLNQANFNFVRHLIFVPTVYNMVLYSGQPQKYSYSTEYEEPVILNQSQLSSELEVVNVRSGETFKTSIRNLGFDKKQLILDDLNKEAGHYWVKDGNEVKQAISYNYPREESGVDFYTNDELQKQISGKNTTNVQLIESDNIANFSETVQALNNGKQLWKYFVVLFIFFLFCEMAINRFWK